MSQSGRVLPVAWSAASDMAPVDRGCENAQLILRRYDTFDFEAEKSKASNLHAWKSHVVSGDFRSAEVFTRPRPAADLMSGRSTAIEYYP